MSSPITPLGDRIVAVREKAAEKTASGIFIPDSAQEKQSIFKVIAIAKDVKSLKVGDRIVCKEYSQSAAELKIAGEEFYIVKEEDVLGTVA